MLVVRLTAKERILIHLADYVKYADLVEVRPEMGQDGVAEAAGIYVQHVRQFIDPLLKDGLLRERTAHVKGHRRRLKVYDLTDSGRLAASRLREQARDEPIRVRAAEGVRETTIGELLRETKGQVPLARMVRAAVDGATLDLVPAKTGARDGFVERLSEVPHVESFVGRQAELETLTALGEGPRFFVVRGVAGIGKSSLAAKVCERLRGRRNLFWHRVRPWDTRETILADLGAFLAALARPGLRAVLARGEADGADLVLREDLPGTSSVLVFDEAHEGSAEVHAVLRFLKDTLAVTPDVRVILLTRMSLPVYDRRDVAVSGLVSEMDLGGLDPKAIEEWLAADPDAPKLLQLADRLGGHPLFLELLRSTHGTEVRPKTLRDVRRFIEEEIYGRLPDRERRMMKVASLYEVPVPREALFADEDLSHDVLLSLLGQALLRPTGDDAYAAHDTIRDFFASVLTPTERAAFAGFAAGQLRTLSVRTSEAGNPIAAISCLSNALHLTDDGPQRTGLWESLGDLNEQIGDLPASITAYMSALKGPDDPEIRARLHRKIATALQNRGETTTPLAEIEEGLRALGGRRSIEEGWLDLVSCRVAMSVEEYAEALEHGHRALQRFQTFGASDAMAEAFLELGRVEIDRDGGQPEQALQFLQDALRHAPAIGSEAFAARTHLEMARNLAWRLLDVDEAMRHIAAAESLVARLLDPQLERWLLILRGRLNLELLANFPVARRDLTEAMAVARRVHSRETIAFARFRLAHVEFFEWHTDKARQEFEVLASEMEALRYPNFVVECWWMVAECSMLIGDTDGFRTALSHLRAPGLVRAIEARPLHAAVLQGLELWLQDRRDDSLAAFREAVSAAERSYAIDVTAPVYLPEIYLAAALRAMGWDEEAADHVRRTEDFLRKHSLSAWLAVISENSRRMSDFLQGVATSPPLGN